MLQDVQQQQAASVASSVAHSGQLDSLAHAAAVLREAIRAMASEWRSLVLALQAALSDHAGQLAMQAASLEALEAAAGGAVGAQQRATLAPAVSASNGGVGGGELAQLRAQVSALAATVEHEQCKRQLLEGVVAGLVEVGVDMRAGGSGGAAGRVGAGSPG